MLYPYTRAWTQAQKWLVVTCCAAALILAAAVIYAYELHVRHSVEATLIDHQWSMQGCMDCSSDLTFRSQHILEVEDDGIGGPYRGTGKWRLHGRNYLEVDYELTMVRAQYLGPEHYHRRWHIAKLTADELVVDDARFATLYTRTK